MKKRKLKWVKPALTDLGNVKDSSSGMPLPALCENGSGAVPDNNFH